MVLITTSSINNELGPTNRFYIGVAAAGRLAAGLDIVQVEVIGSTPVLVRA